MHVTPTRHAGQLLRHSSSPVLAVALVALLALGLAPARPVELAGAGGVPAQTETLDLPAATGADPAAGAATRQVDLEAFQLLGVSWTGAGSEGGRVRVRTAGTWDGWVELDFEDRAEPGSGEDANPRRVSEPIWVEEADGYELEVPDGAGDVEVHLVRAGASGAQPLVLAAASDPDAPPITSRSSWGAREPKDIPEAAARLRAGFVHHTVSANDYAPADVPGILRGIQAYHMDVNGWDDIGYNFLVDRSGQIWEGRAGGIDRNVIGAHVAGFNTGSVGVAVLGDHRSVQPTSASLGAVGEVLGWRLGRVGIDPQASTTMTGPDGATRTLRTISGHRDAGDTECPGQALYDQLPLVRSAAADKAATVTVVPEPELPPPARIDTACPPGAVPGGRFSDIAGNVHATAVECLAWYEIASGGPGGRPPDRYGPELVVTRGQVASFVARLIDRSDPGLLPPADVDFSCPSDPGLAVPAGHPHRDAILRLAAAGVVGGGVGGSPTNCFGPDLEVARGQMATFLAGAADLVGADLGAGPDYFSDDDDSAHEAAINAVSAEGIAQGTGAGQFAPGEPVRRDQMGSFLARTLNLFVEGGLASPPA
ncbi:MAG TPA: S-layer homology domain-containing protein [Acidimicrobiales bacterium]|nr:S-layer homology domain-containing protein [Acidimicrobiales bacterium]